MFHHICKLWALVVANTKHSLRWFIIDQLQPWNTDIESHVVLSELHILENAAVGLEIYSSAGKVGKVYMVVLS